MRVMDIRTDDIAYLLHSGRRVQSKRHRLPTAQRASGTVKAPISFAFVLYAMMDIERISSSIYINIDMPPTNKISNRYHFDIIIAIALYLDTFIFSFGIGINNTGIPGDGRQTPFDTINSRGASQDDLRSTSY